MTMNQFKFDLYNQKKVLNQENDQIENENRKKFNEYRMNIKFSINRNRDRVNIMNRTSSKFIQD